MTALSIVIPAYNEEDGIETIARRVLSVRDDLLKVGVDLAELLVVDDGSRDRTAEIAAGIPGVTLIRHAKNKGYGGALKTGFGAAQGDLVGFLDADGTYPPEYFPQLCVKAMNGTDLVIGSRMAGAESHMPPMRRIGNFFFANLLSLISNQKVTDSASGMRVFKRAMLERMYPLPDGLNLTPVMSTRAIHEGIRVAEVPIPYSERVGRSKLSVVRDGYVFLQSIVWTALAYNPVSILGKLGLVGVGLAALAGLWLVGLRLTGTTTLGALEVGLLFAALLAGVVGVSVFALGVTFNYLVTLFYKQPVRQGLFGKPIFKTPLDRHFGWAGLLAALAGLGLGAVSFGLSLTGWEIARLWLYLLGSAMLTLVGVQLVIYWILLRVLEELSQREILSRRDLDVA
ncbi:MAG: glycosyltransferase family 2 protein [Anaerolineales bacterium]|nr:glycosyltransferase family 2 protein [Anaerolineales bacterium]